MRNNRLMSLPVLAVLVASAGALAADRHAPDLRSLTTRVAHMTNSAMVDALHAGKPDEALASKLHLYGQFVGSWHIDVDYHAPGGPARRVEGEWHFDWVLDGKAIQDVFIVPSRRLREEKPAEPWHFYGSTVRWYDPAIDAWHITYFEPTRPFAIRQVGRAAGPDIVQLADEQNGVVRRWRFVEIKPESFRWIGEASSDKGATWTLEMEMRARRIE